MIFKFTFKISNKIRNVSLSENKYKEQRRVERRHWIHTKCSNFKIVFIFLLGDFFPQNKDSTLITILLKINTKNKIFLKNISLFILSPSSFLFDNKVLCQIYSYTPKCRLRSGLIIIYQQFLSKYRVNDFQQNNLQYSLHWSLMLFFDHFAKRCGNSWLITCIILGIIYKCI